MTIASRRKRRDRRRTFFLFVAYALGLIVLFRVSGIAVVHLESSAMEPVLSVGDRFLTVPPRRIERGSIVLLQSPLYRRRIPVFAVRRNIPSWTLRSVAALPGDTVIVRSTDIVVITPAGNRIVYDSASLVSPAYFSGERQVTISEGEIFLLAEDDRFIDSREWGVTSRSALFGKVRVRIWPLPDIRFFR